VTIGPDVIGQAGLQFFGRMSASISHELKNALAIIKENSGLLNDYLGMMAKGVPIEPQRFQTVAKRIETQTVRADAIIKNLNQFAHTIDSSTKPVDLNELLTLFLALHNRPAAMRQVALETGYADSPVVISTSPFILLNILGLALDFALNAVPPGGTLSITVGKSQTEALVGFGGLKTLSNMSALEYPGACDNALLTALGAQARIEKGEGRIIIALAQSQNHSTGAKRR
jgi:C4-dicarboxylate-specific signal transduction histidine kinase